MNGANLDGTDRRAFVMVRIVDPWEPSPHDVPSIAAGGSNLRLVLLYSVKTSE